MNQQYLTVLLIMSTCFNVVYANVDGDDYMKIKELQDSILSSDNYSTTIRPVINQSTPLIVEVTFSLIAVVSVDNVKQELITNGFLVMIWNDERNNWNPDDYGGFDRLLPDAKDIWKPRLLLSNTLGDDDPFEKDHRYRMIGDDVTFMPRIDLAACNRHTFFSSDGHMAWVPGGLFHTFCALNMEKFPFDTQICKIQTVPLGYTNTSVQFVAAGVDLPFYYPNPGWELQTAEVTIENVSTLPGETFSCPTITFGLKRRPASIILNVIVPVIMLSVLNNLVFLIPVDSGEKISYAITVLLSLAVFLSMVSTMTPQVSDVVPALTIYLFALLLFSVLTVAAAIFTVYLHHLDEKEECSIKSKINFQKSVKRAFTLKTAITPFGSSSKDPLPKDTDSDPAFLHNTTNVPGHNPYRNISKHINKIFFVLINMLSLIMTLWYFIFTNS